MLFLFTVFIAVILPTFYHLNKDGVGAQYFVDLYQAQSFFLVFVACFPSSLEKEQCLEKVTNFHTWKKKFHDKSRQLQQQNTILVQAVKCWQNHHNRDGTRKIQYTLIQFPFPRHFLRCYYFSSVAALDLILNDPCFFFSVFSHKTNHQSQKRISFPPLQQERNKKCH